MEPEIIEQLLDFMRSRYFGKYRGTVTSNTDTTRGRLTVRVPAVLGNAEVEAMPCVPYAGKGVGFYCLPEPGTAVWVEFEGGDISSPIWVGCFWADGELPDESDANIKVWKTNSLTLRLDDKNDEILVEASSGSKIVIASDIVSESGGAAHSVSSSGVVSDSGGSGKVEVGSASVKINDGAMEVI